MITIDRSMSRAGIVLGETRSMKLEAGMIRDDFAPYAVHLYAVPTLATTTF